MSMFKKKINEFPTPYTCKNAVKKGGVETKLSMILMGFWKHCTWSDYQRTFVSGS